MAINTDISDILFSQSVSSLNNKKIGVGVDAFSAQYAAQMYDPELTKPTGYEVPEIEEKTQDIDVPGGSDPLVTDLSDAVMLFTDEEKEKERKKLGTSVTGVDAQLNALGPFGSAVAKISSNFKDSKGIGVSSVPPLASYDSPASTGSIEEEMTYTGGGGGGPDSGEMPEQLPGVAELRDAYNSGEFAYNQMFSTGPTYTGQNTITTSPSSEFGKYAGSGVDLSTYSKSFQTGLATTSTQGSIGLSSAPPFSLAGQGTGLTMAPYTGSATASAAPVGYGAIAQQGIKVGTAAAINAGWTGTGYGGINKAGGMGTWGSAFKVGGQLLALYGIQQAFASGTAEGKVSGTLMTAALLNPALAPYVALYEGIKMLTGWAGFGGKEKHKEPMGGTEFRLSTNPNETNEYANNFVYPGGKDFDQLIKDDALRITAPYSWGYNGYNHSIVKSQARKQIDYLYGFADRYNVDVNEDVFMKAAIGAGGFAKHKPVGDRAPGTKVSVLERIDSVGNGSTTANQWLREVFEYTGPNGEKIVSGTPTSNEIDLVTGLKKGFASQEEFENDITQFSQNFYS